MLDFLKRTYFGNTVQDYLIALGIIIIGLLLVRFFKRIVLERVRNWTRKTNTHLDDFVMDSISRFGIPALQFSIIYVGISYLTFAARAQYVIQIATTLVITFLVIRLVSSTILLVLQSYIRREYGSDEKVKQLGGIMLIINLVIWMVGLVFIFDNMGYDVTAVITGLGIGGIAIALAAQNILGDLFNYFVIFFDRPVEIGDFIVVDDKNGVVDNIGLKTTRIKTLSGEQLIVSNSDLSKSRIHNFKRMEQRRIVFKLGITYQASLDQVKKIPGLLKSIIEEQTPVKFDRAHFVAYGDYSLNFEVVYYVLDPDYLKYMDIQQTINFRIYEEFEKLGVEFAYPTRTVFVMNPQTEELAKPEQNGLAVKTNR
jgi:small-conductance mechanosensitive channel